RAVAGLVPGAEGVGLLGISFGSGVALQAAALDRSVASVLSLSTYRTGEEWLRDMRPLHEMASLLATLDAARRTGTAGHEVMIPVTRVFPRDPIGASYEQNMRDEGSKRARELDATSVEQIVRFRPIDHACALRVKASHFVHCNDDVTMAVAHARDFADRAHGSIEVLPGVDHYQVYQPQHLEPLCDRIAAFFGRTLGVGQ
ncbi:MAG TPA: alpha/beta hydrolase, partial [Ilumatobacteraceae bacterium]